MSDNKEKEGWVFLGNASKRHYFRNSRALCGKWLYQGKTFEDVHGYDSSNCKSCRRARLSESRKAKQQAAILAALGGKE